MLVISQVKFTLDINFNIVTVNVYQYWFEEMLYFI